MRTGGDRWARIMARAEEIAVDESPMTFMDLYLRLEGEGHVRPLSEGRTDYVRLSARTAEARRDGSFPLLYSAGQPAGST